MWDNVHLLLNVRMKMKNSHTVKAKATTTRPAPHYRWQPSSRCNNWIWHHRLTRWTYSTGCRVQSDGIGEHLFCSLVNLNWKAGYAICKTVQKLMKLICECIWWRHTGYITTQRVSCKANLGKPLCGNLAYACSLCKPILQCPLCNAHYTMPTMQAHFAMPTMNPVMYRSNAQCTCI